MSDNVKPSKTSPQFAATLRKIMLVAQIINKRNAEFENELKAHLKLYEGKKVSDLFENPKQQKKRYAEAFSRAYYAEEMKAISEFEAIRQRHEKRQDPSFSDGVSPDVIDREKYILSQGLEHYVAQSLFSDESFASLSKKYPKEAESLKREIQIEAESFKSSFPASAAHMPATVRVFNKRYPQLGKELENMRQNSAPESHSFKLSTAALGMLKVGSAAMNPSAYLVKMAIGAILQTKTMQPLVKGVAHAIENVVQKTGLKERIRNQFSDVSWKRVAVATAGLAALGTAGLMAVGIVDYEESKLLVAKTYDSISAWVSENAKNVGDITAQNELPMGSEPYNLENIEQPTATTDTVLKSETSSDLNATSDKTEIAPEESAPEASNETQEQAVTNSAEEATPLSPTVLDSKVYRIVPGDTLSQIVEARLREAGVPYNYSIIQQHMDVISQLNGIEDQNKIFAGRQLELPPISGNTAFISPAETAKGLKSTLEPFTPSYKFDELIAQDPFVSQDPLVQANITLGTTPVYPVSDGVMQIESEQLRSELANLSREKVSFNIVDENGNTLSQQSGSLSKLGFITEGVSSQDGELRKTVSVNGENAENLITRVRAGESISIQEWQSVQAAATEHKSTHEDLRTMRRGMR